MGLTHATLKVTNALNGKSVDVRFLVDSGAMLTCVPDDVAVQLGFDTEECLTRLVTVADGRSLRVPVIRPLVISWDENRSCSADALVLGHQPLLGVTTIESLDLIIDPTSQLLRTPPDRPNFPVYPVL